MSFEGKAEGDDALPDDGKMRLYARAYGDQPAPHDLFLRWETCTAHAMLLGHAPDRFYHDYGLNGRQLAEGARTAARRMALLMAEVPTDLREVLALKAHAFETMHQLEDEFARSHTAVMLERAMKADAERMDLVLLPLGSAPGWRQ